MRKAAVCSLFFASLMLAVSAPAFGQISVSVAFGPPALPVYDQPVCPGDGYLWTPGYWAWDDVNSDYFWVPGTWVEPPEVGLFWTPGYWGWGGSGFIFNEGYWGPQVGFYGGINYGFGYFGDGYVGGRWDGGHFFYNRDVSNVNVTIIHNVYNERVDVRNNQRVSFNGGNGGISARATAPEEAAARDRRAGPIAAQSQQVQAARGNTELRASVNHGKPPIAATPRAGAFNDRDSVKAKDAGAPYTPPASRGNEAERVNASAAPKATVHPRDLPPMERPAAPSTGDAKLDNKYQQQQDQLMAQQNKERQNLQKQQDKEHQQLTKQNADDQRTQQLEQTHQQQTQQMVQRHTEQQQNLQNRQQPPPARAAAPRAAPEGEKPR
ncbi:MAG TPA: YXWGXW repeat-containing protein [Candidatus Acidoferrales bacterium]|nr:YXWGXW repeat-containing protein [Candidatus Acidoferrales bacterium]